MTPQYIRAELICSVSKRDRAGNWHRVDQGEVHRKIEVIETHHFKRIALHVEKVDLCMAMAAVGGIGFILRRVWAGRESEGPASGVGVGVVGPI